MTIKFVKLIIWHMISFQFLLRKNDDIYKKIRAIFSQFIYFSSLPHPYHMQMML